METNIPTTPTTSPAMDKSPTGVTPITPNETNNLMEILELVKQFVMENAKISIEPEEIEEAFRAVFPPKNTPKQ